MARRKRLLPTRSPSTGDRDWSLEKGALAIQHVLQMACGFYWYIDSKETDQGPSSEWDHRRAKWVLGWSVLLVVLWLVNPGPLWLRLLVGGVAAWRLLEILVTALGTALGEKTQIKARNLITIGFYGLQLVLIFAISYHSFAAGHFIAENSAVTDSHIASSDYLYMSWSNFTSLGNDLYVPEGDAARFLEVATTSAGILLLGVLLAFGIDRIKDDDATTTGSGGSDSPAG